MQQQQGKERFKKSLSLVIKRQKRLTKSLIIFTPHQNNIRGIKWRRMQCTRHLSCMGEKIIHWRFWRIYLNKTESLEGVNAYWKIILRRNEKKLVVRLSFKFIWLKIRIGGAFLWIFNETSDSVKYGDFLYYSSPEELRSMELIPESCQTTTSEILYLRIQ
jgi:hypothetical protein